MKVIGAAFSDVVPVRLKPALEDLGFGPSYSLSYSLSEVFAHPEHVGAWETARGAAKRGSAGDKVDWQEFLVPYEVAVDWPACSFYGELMDACPECP